MESPMNPPHSTTRFAARSRRSPATLVLSWLVLLLLPAAADASPITYGFSTGSVTFRSNLEGQTQSIFQGPSSVAVPLTSLSVVFDSAAGPYGRLESFSLTGEDFSVDVDENLVGADFIDVFSPTITSLSGSDLNVFGQFAVTTRLDAQIGGTLPGGTGFGPFAIQSAGSSGSATGLVNLSNDELLISIVGVTIASFEAPSILGQGAPAIEVKADFTFVGVASNPIPEPGAAILFGAGIIMVSSAARFRAPRSIS